jgi:glyoxylase-like metal-dependent hydrolase (beta-lactamase superfamily II)
MLQQNVAPGVHRIEDAFTNWYLVEQDSRITVVDAGVPSSWDSLQEALKAIGRSQDDVEALVLTHAHFDHVGFAERARTTLKIPVYVHETDVEIAKHPWSYKHERSRVPYLLTQVKAMPIVATLLRHRAFWPKPVEETTSYDDGTGTLPVPGEPRIVATPGHTLGHCALHLPDRDVVIAGDAVVMLDPYTGRRGPRLVARAATADVATNLRTLDALKDTGARTVLTGHGDPWSEGAAAIVEQARSAGAA